MKHFLLPAFIGICTTLSIAAQDKMSSHVTRENIPMQEKHLIPRMEITPAYYWNCTGILSIPNRNSIEETDSLQGLPYHLLCQSISGLANRAVDEGKISTGVWLNDHGHRSSYANSLNKLEHKGMKCLGMRNGLELAISRLSSDTLHAGTNTQQKLFSGYVLTDVRSNPESGIAASVASHVYNALIVDVRDSALFNRNGYTLVYNATRKTTREAWHEFKEHCSNRALVIMPVQTGELRDFAIKNRLFVLNLNHRQADPNYGQNTDLLDEILQWLAPNAPILGWEQGLPEDKFVSRASFYGHPVIPCDWSYNLPLASLCQESVRPAVLAKNLNPHLINFQEKDCKKYVSFILSDGDNVQWMFQDFLNEYVEVTEATQTKMSYGMPVTALSNMAPAQMELLLQKQQEACPVIEMLGGGYYYADTYSQHQNRDENLRQMARYIAGRMQRHDVRLLCIMAMDARSDATIETCQVYADANRDLEGIVLLQYSPYAGGEGSVFWVTNRQGYDIPVIAVSYTLWDRKHEREGSPAFVASKLQSDTNTFSVVCVHAWSTFCGKKGAAAAEQCVRLLEPDTKVISLQEMCWRLCMKQHPEQTLKRLSDIPNPASAVATRQKVPQHPQ